MDMAIKLFYSPGIQGPFYTAFICFSVNVFEDPSLLTPEDDQGRNMMGCVRKNVFHGVDLLSSLEQNA